MEGVKTKRSIDATVNRPSNLPAHEIIAADIIEDLQADVTQFAEIASDLRK
jgi:hypothetical protein